jgi:outer membrane protein TolC
MGPQIRKTGWIAIALAVMAPCAANSTSPAAPLHVAADVAAPATRLAASAPPTRCIDEDAPVERAPAAAPAPVGAEPHARSDLLDLVQLAIRRSNAVGAAKLLAEAAAIDVDETRAGKIPQVNLQGQAGGIDAGATQAAPVKGSQAQGALTVTAPLYDFGHIDSLANWRAHLADAARFGEISAQEQVALQTVSLALERSRFTVESQVYDQYARKMACLVDALEQIVSADKGRASELVQARKTQQQAELARDQTLSQKRLSEVRLRRFVGDELPPTAGMTSVMLEIPQLQDMLALAARSSDIAQLDAQAEAQQSYVRAVLAGQKPQFGWLVSATKSAGAGNAHSVTGGVTLSIPLYDAANDYTTAAARKRAAAAKLQRDDALEERQYHMRAVHEEAEHALARAHDIVATLHNSELVRNSTLQQWQQLGRRSLFDVMSAEGDHYSLRVQYVDALYDTQQSNALLWSLGLGLAVHLE